MASALATIAEVIPDDRELLVGLPTAADVALLPRAGSTIRERKCS
jgi:hypothetical protein